jgi:hypothetical protein
LDGRRMATLAPGKTSFGRVELTGVTAIAG